MELYNHKIANIAATSDYSQWIERNKSKFHIQLLLKLNELKLSFITELCNALLTNLYLKDLKIETITPAKQFTENLFVKISKENKDNRDGLNIALEYLSRLKLEIESNLNRFQFVNNNHEETLNEIGRNYKILFNYFIGIMSLTIVIALFGITLIFLNRITVGLVVTIVDIIPAVTSKMINQSYKRLENQKRELLITIEKSSSEYNQRNNILLAINRINLVTDPEKRNDAIIKLAETLSNHKL